MSMEPMTLPDDRTTAFRHLADYLESVRTGTDRRHRESVEGRPELLGYWQTPEWCTGLQELAAECRRLADLKPIILARRIVGFQNVHLPGPDGSTVPTLLAMANDGTVWSVHACHGGCEFVQVPQLPQPLI